MIGDFNAHPVVPVSNKESTFVGIADTGQMETAVSISRSLGPKDHQKSVSRIGLKSGGVMAGELEEVIDQLWLYSTHEEDPWTVDRAFAAIRDHGEVAIDGLIWALGQKDLDLLILALRLLREFGEAGKRALPAVEKCLLDERRLVRVTARETVRCFKTK